MKIIDIVFDSGNSYNLYCTDYDVSDGVAVFRKNGVTRLIVNLDKIKYIQES